MSAADGVAFQIQPVLSETTRPHTHLMTILRTRLKFRCSLLSFRLADRKAWHVTETLSKTFTERRFGEAAPAVTAALVRAGQEAHARSLDAKIGSRLKSNHAYGSTFWLALPQEVVACLLPLLDGAIPFPPHGSQYELLVWKGIAILPVKVIDGATRHGRMRARLSHLRTSLTSVNMPEPPEATLLDQLPGFQIDDFEQEALNVVENARKALLDIATTMVVAAYACNATGGLQVVEVGIATLDEGGFIHFSDSQRLSIVEPAAKSAKPVPVAGDSFTSAPRPKPALGLVEDERTATGEAQPEGQVDAPEPE